MIIAQVIVDVPAKQVNQTFDYLVPDKFHDILENGMRVIVPFGPRKVMGFVINITNDSKFKRLRKIIDVLDLTPVLTDEMIELGKWVAEHTLSYYITAYQAMLPQVLKAAYKKEIVRLTEDELIPELEVLFAGRDVINFDEITKANIPYRLVQKAIQAGDIYINYIVQSKATKKYITMVRPILEDYQLMEALEDLPKNAKKQRVIIEHFINQSEPLSQKELIKRYSTSYSTIKQLKQKGLIETYQQEIYRHPYDDKAFTKTYPLPLTEQQKKAIQPIKQIIHKEEHKVVLLHGVTGSGKTEIYLQAIQDVLNNGKEAIVLVPEISLTPQMVKRFKGRFGESVAVFHSALSAGEKYDEWRKIYRGEVKVVVGARSAVFAPFENIGIIIIDEEHEVTYKQEDQPRYHARDVAIERGLYHQCPVILGSATPTLESYARALKGVYQLAVLDKRTNNQAMPEVKIVDMRQELHAGNRTMFSRLLKLKIEEALKRKEQIILLLNRRGFSTFVMCRDCGQVNECPHCDIALTYHKSSHRLKCHYCSYEEPMPIVCPACQSEYIRYFGTGTERVEEALTKLIPEARIIRMDVDTTRRKGAHERLLERFRNYEADILLGTQMIAKGLDFENVTLVGVLTADSMLHLPDFRSSEKTFQLLTQVSGRAGRHELPGEVIIQTYTPEHYSIQLASQYDYVQFFNIEMRLRRQFQYPPYVFISLITVSHPDHLTAINITEEIVQYLSKHLAPQTSVLGPTPSPIMRIKDRYRYQCMIKYKKERHLKEIINMAIRPFEDQMNQDELQIIIDMQPYQFM